MFDQPRGMFGVDDRDASSLAGILGNYLRSVMSGQVAAGGVLGQNNYDPNASFAQNALNPAAIENATNIGLSMGTGPIKAYHGSPYDFEKFDLAKIGTGEGAQAYGHGLYFAENEGVARNYRDALAPNNTKWMYGDTALSGAEQNAAEILDRTKDVDKALGWVQHALRPGRMADQSYLDATEAAIRRMDPAKVRVVQDPGKMYEVNINADPDAFLNYDKPLSGQPHVQAALNKLGVSPGPRWELLPKTPLMTGAGRLAPEEASAALRRQGIPGIKYLDQGSRGAGEGSSNYVVFDPSIIEILRKYGILGPIAAPGTLAPFMGDQQQ